MKIGSSSPIYNQMTTWRISRPMLSASAGACRFVSKHVMGRTHVDSTCSCDTLFALVLWYFAAATRIQARLPECRMDLPGWQKHPDMPVIFIPAQSTFKIHGAAFLCIRILGRARLAELLPQECDCRNISVRNGKSDCGRAVTNEAINS